MNEKEVSEIRRRFRADKSSISRVRGCYVNEHKEVVSEFNQSLGIMGQEETEQLLSVLKKTLSGTLGKNLIDIEFATQQVVDSDEHNLLMALRNSSLQDDEALHEFMGRIIQSIKFEGNYLILLACDKYDVPSYSKDGEQIEDGSENVFSYFVCAICPVKLTKPTLGYYAHENRFKTISPDWAVSAPEFGFMFPSFDDRAANIYNALYYSKDIAQAHSDFIDTVFKTEFPMPPAQQKETFQNILEETVAEDCSFDVVQGVHDQIAVIIEEYKETKNPEPLKFSKGQFTDVLESSGVSEEKIEVFKEKYDLQFGADTEISPKNIVDVKKFEVKTPDVSIKVNPERSDLVQTKIINGTKYILIRANDGVEVNGIQINISENEE
ncbi:MAG: DUF4317 domain-containing protein [Clostridiales bacterium]|nr:DUF4317 domain-containing protein [Clostridiales bacterium]